MNTDDYKDRDDIILTSDDSGGWRKSLQHLGCRNCGQEYYTNPRRLASGCVACGVSESEWDGEAGLFKELDVTDQ